MPSSISSSDPNAEAVIERSVPALPWSRASVVALVVFAVLMAGWEWHARTSGLSTEDIGDGPSRWAEERRKLDRGDPSQIAIVGDSRILFDTDLDLFERMTGVRPVQLALPGTNARPFVQDVADDEDFRGLLLVGIAERSYFRDQPGRMGHALERYRFESPNDYVGDRLYRTVSRLFAFIDYDNGLLRGLRRLDLPNRGDIYGPYLEVWKIRVTAEDRHNWLWPRLETDAYRREQARAVWLSLTGAPPVPDEQIAKTIAITREAVAKIRARGGEVIFLRPPSSGPVLDSENKGTPRAKVWDALLRGAGLAGVHFADYPQMRDLDLPEYSHLSRACARHYTRAYVGAVAALTDRLRIVDADAAIDATADCRRVDATARSDVQQPEHGSQPPTVLAGVGLVGEPARDGRIAAASATSDQAEGDGQ